MKALTKSDARDLRPLLKVPENPVLQEVGRRHEASAAQVAPLRKANSCRGPHHGAFRIKRNSEQTRL